MSSARAFRTARARGARVVLVVATDSHMYNVE